MAITDTARSEVTTLLYRYAAAADALDVESVTTLLEHAEVDFAGQHAVNAPSIRQLYTSLFEGAPVVKHLISNPIVDLDPADPTRIIVDCAYLRWPAVAATGPLGLGEYHARFVLREGTWQFAALAVHRLWSTSPPTDTP